VVQASLPARRTANRCTFDRIVDLGENSLHPCVLVDLFGDRTQPWETAMDNEH